MPSDETIAPEVPKNQTGADTTNALGWRSAGDLRAGDIVITRDGRRARVKAVDPGQGVSTVFNFAVRDHHTYFVGHGPGIWVHNDYRNKILREKLESLGVTDRDEQRRYIENIEDSLGWNRTLSDFERAIYASEDCTLDCLQRLPDVLKARAQFQLELGQTYKARGFGRDKSDRLFTKTMAQYDRLASAVALKGGDAPLDLASYIDQFASIIQEQRDIRSGAANQPPGAKPLPDQSFGAKLKVLWQAITQHGDEIVAGAVAGVDDEIFRFGDLLATKIAGEDLPSTFDEFLLTGLRGQEIITRGNTGIGRDLTYPEAWYLYKFAPKGTTIGVDGRVIGTIRNFVSPTLKDGWPNIDSLKVHGHVRKDSNGEIVGGAYDFEPRSMVSPPGSSWDERLQIFFRNGLNEVAIEQHGRGNPFDIVYLYNDADFK